LAGQALQLPGAAGQDQALQAPTDDTLAGKGPEPSSDTPVLATPAEIKAKFGLNKTNENRLISIWKLFKDDWNVARRSVLRDTLRHIEY
jgi:hypothetical protein